MRLHTSALALVFAIVAAGFGFNSQAATPLEIWPQQFSSLDKNALKAQTDMLDSAAATLPQPVAPAVRFQRIFLRIISGAPASAWRDDVQKIASSTGKEPVESALAEISRAWLARLEMADIDVELHNYYRRNVRFPETLAEVEADIPANIRKDPWGDPWIYKPVAPQGFERLEDQRYQLGPTRFPQLGSLSQAVSHRAVQIPAWTISPRDISGSTALEFRSDRSGTSVITTVQAGGRVDDCILLFIGDHWALMAGVDQLFAVTF
jgi:hypothetical protein